MGHTASFISSRCSSVRLFMGFKDCPPCAASRCTRSRSCLWSAVSRPEGCAEAENALGALRSGSLPWSVELYGRLGKEGCCVVDAIELCGNYCSKRSATENTLRCVCDVFWQGRGGLKFESTRLERGRDGGR